MKLIKHALVLLLIISTLFSTVSCGKKSKNKKGNNDEGLTSCTITVKNPLGKPLPNVAVYLHHEDGSDYNVCAEPKGTNLDGKVTFSLSPNKKYSVGIMRYPGAYTAKSGATSDERYHLNSDNLEIVLQIKEGYAPKRYNVGDYMGDFTLTDIDGQTHNLYSILKEKRAVVLNFWYYSCGPCAGEFPALNTAYNTYKDTLEVLAVNDYPSDTVDMVKGYESYRGFTLDMPMLKVNYGSEVSLSRFDSDAYPTTVIIDRYGMISYLHTGMINSVSKWNEIFEYYTSDNYNGEPYN